MKLKIKTTVQRISAQSEQNSSSSNSLISPVDQSKETSMRDNQSQSTKLTKAVDKMLTFANNYENNIQQNWFVITKIIRLQAFFKTNIILSAI